VVEHVLVVQVGGVQQSCDLLQGRLGWRSRRARRQRRRDWRRRCAAHRRA
jgi:hypothetical protein